MRKLSVFNNISLDGYFTDRNNELNWAHTNDPEWDEFVAGNAKGEGELLFGRITYDMMASFWPTEFALKSFPDVARGMNMAPKVVFSKTMDKPAWNNTRLMKSNLIDEVGKLKNEEGPGMVILGSGSIVSQLTDVGLIDEYQVVFHPVVLGSGRTMF